jgi:hypothetical protein
LIKYINKKESDKMPTPAKSVDVLIAENKTNKKTKTELERRKKAEEALRTTPLKERPEVKENPIAHKEFMRLNKLLKDLKKNDALYEPVINRYCELQAECLDLKQQRINLQELIDEIKETFRELTAEMNVEERASLAIELTRSLIKLTDGIDKIDKNIQSKRKMMFDIEKENIFTISAALRSIPKKEEKTANPLLEALKGGNVDES